MSLAAIGEGIGNAIGNLGTYSAKAASRANSISAAAQSAQGNFNQSSANNANSLADARLASQYGFNSGQAASANAFTEQMWDRSAAWNESMFERQMEFNAAEAQKQRDWQEHMAKTAYQRAVKDMEKAGLNPILAVTGGGIETGGGSGSAASVSSPSMSGASGAMASGGLLQGVSASESNYTGQMEYLSGTLGLISAVIGSVSSAMGGLGSLGDLGKGLGDAIAKIFEKPDTAQYSKDKINSLIPDNIQGDSNGYRNGVKWNRNKK